MSGFSERIIRILYPRHCPICGEVISYWEEFLCRSCAGKLKPITEPRCKKCSKPLAQEEKEYCLDCGRESHYYNRGYALYTYNADLKRSVFQIKNSNRREYLDFYAAQLAAVYGDRIRTWQAEALIPVPMHRSQQKKRGFNQAEYLADRLGRQLGIPVCRDLVKRKRRTAEQKALSRRERRQNLQDAFTVNGQRQFKRVIIIDDVYTTGSTINAVAREILKTMTEQVYFLTICIGEGDG